MGEIEPIRFNSANDSPSDIEAVIAAGDFHSSPRSGRADLASARRNAQKRQPETEDEVVLSDVAEVSLREEEGMSVTAIATDLGLTPATVLTDIVIASAICHPPASAS